MRISLTSAYDGSLDTSEKELKPAKSLLKTWVARNPDDLTSFVCLIERKSPDNSPQTRNLWFRFLSGNMFTKEIRLTVIIPRTLDFGLICTFQKDFALLYDGILLACQLGKTAGKPDGCGVTRTRKVPRQQVKVT